MASNKGFAFSTMLYGVLSLIMVVLILLFSVLKNTNDETYYYASTVENSLNKCVDKEVELEKCYTSSSAFCSPSSYYSCLGVTDNSVDSVRAIEFFETKVVYAGDGVYSDNDKLVFKGINVNNYLKFLGYVWRIVEIESDGSLKIAYTKYDDDLSFSTSSNNEWTNSDIKKELEQNFYESLSDKAHIEKKNWNVGKLSSDVTTLTSLIAQEESSRSLSASIGLLNVSDYTKAALNEICQNDVFNVSCTSWLSSYSSWLLNANQSVSNEAYYFDELDRLVVKKVTEKGKIIPVIYLSGDTKISGGDGTISDPYILKW